MASSEFTGFGIRLEPGKPSEFTGFAIRFEPVRPSAFEGFAIRFDHAEPPRARVGARRRYNPIN
ncbi:MAG: hypothetical protein ACO1OQ_12805 [Rufibacter sp.]